MSSLKNMAIEKKVPAKIPSKPKFHKAFTEIVGKHGRMNETELQLRLLDKTRPREVLRNARFGVQMWRKGKVKLSPSTIGRIKDLKAIFESASKRGERE
jgi:heterodisulfide reductase subunit C